MQNIVRNILNDFARNVYWIWHIYVYIYIRTHARTRSHTHTHTHTHTHIYIWYTLKYKHTYAHVRVFHDIASWLVMNRIFIFTGFDGILPLDDERHLQHCHPTFRIRTIHGYYVGPFNVTQTSCYYCLATTSVPPRSSILLRKPHQPICFLNVPHCGLSITHPQ